MNWIDLFNIGNVMLMRGQEIQVSHSGTSEFCELDDVVAQLASVEEGMPIDKVMDRNTGTSVLTSEYGASLPDLSLAKCSRYAVGKDSFTELVLLTVIAYFCVSTEQRFINLSQDKADAKSGLNVSSHTLGSGSGNMNSTLRQSTKAQTSVQRPEESVALS